MMRFAKQISLITALLLTVSLGSIVSIAVKHLWTGVLEGRRADLSAFDQLLYSSLQSTSATALAEAQIIAHQPGIIDLTEARDREAVRTRLADVYEYLRSQAGVNVFQLQTSALRTLIRLHNLSSFDDDVSTSRPIVVAGMRTKRGQQGIEIGPTGIIAIRGVAPVMRGDQIFGTVEIGTSALPILQRTKDSTDMEAAVVLSVSMVGRKSAEDRVYGDLLLNDSTDAKLFARLLDTGTLSLGREPKQVGVQLDGVNYAVSMQPMLDFSGRMIGGLLGAKNVSAEQRQFERQVLMLVFAAIVSLIVIYGTIMVAIRALVSAPLLAMSHYAGKIDDPETKEPTLGGDTGINALLSPILAALTRLAAAQRPAPPADKPGETAPGAKS
jgi:hypothetical protein